MRKRSGLPNPRAQRGNQRRARTRLGGRFSAFALFALFSLAFGPLAPNVGAQSIPENLVTCGYLNVVLTASGPVAADAAKSLKGAAGSDLDAAEVASLDQLIESGTAIEGDGAAKLKTRSESSCADVDVCPLLSAIDGDDVAAISQAALVLRDLSQPVPPSVALALRDLIDADEADAPFTSQRERIHEYFADANCPAGGGSTDSGNTTTGGDSNSTGGGTATSTPAPTTTSANPTATPSAADSTAVANMAEQALSGSGSPTATPAPSTTSPVAVTPAATPTSDALPNTGLGTEALYFSFAAAALVAAGAWMLAVPGIRR